MVVLITVMRKNGHGWTKWIGKPSDVFCAVIGTAVAFIRGTNKELKLKPDTMAKFMDMEVNRMLGEGETEHEQ